MNWKQFATGKRAQDQYKQLRVDTCAIPNPCLDVREVSRHQEQEIIILGTIENAERVR